jgi:hypothetical protein
MKPTIIELPETKVLPFLENRDYLHGTTLFAHLSRLVPNEAKVCFRIMRIIRCNSITVKNAGSVDSPVARLDWRLGDASGALAVEEACLKMPIERRRYDESSIINTAVFDERSCMMPTRLPFDALATSVPLFKALLRANKLNPAGGQWMLTRLDTFGPEPISAVPLTVSLEKVHPATVAKSSIYLGGNAWADMYFSWVAEDRSKQHHSKS